MTGWRQVAFFPGFVPGRPVPACLKEARPAGQTKTRARLRRMRWLAATVAVVAMIPSSLTGSLAAESTSTQERSVLGPSAGAATHGEATTLINGFNRQEWGLSEAEWQRYHTLSQGIRGSISPANLSPLEVLGIHARDDQERRDYAKRWAKVMQEDIARVLAFQMAYDEAFAALSPSTPWPATGRLPRGPDGAEAGDRLLLFVRLDDCPRCERHTADALALQRASGAKLDIYVVGGGTDDAIRSWAKLLNIDPAAVRDRRLTLNHDHGELVRVVGLAATVPVLIRLRDGAATRLDGSS